MLRTNGKQHVPCCRHVPDSHATATGMLKSACGTASAWSRHQTESILRCCQGCLGDVSGKDPHMISVVGSFVV